MAAHYKFIDHTADIACEASGDTLEELFKASAMAWRCSVINGKISGNGKIKKFKFKAASKEQLLVNFLNELNFMLLVKNWLFSLIKIINIKQNNGIWVLSTAIEGSPVSEDIEIIEEIKAITFHQMNIEKVDDKYFTLIVFDI